MAHTPATITPEFPRLASLVQRKPTQITNQSGQSLIEFIFTFAFTIGIIFLFAAQGYNMAIGYVAHYANFMASRTYLTADYMTENFAEANEPAITTFQRYKLDFVGLPSTPTFRSYTQPSSQSGNGMYVGTYLEYQKPFSYLGLLGGNTQIKYMTESYLGKEPIRVSCYCQTFTAITGSLDCDQALSATNLQITVDDNGC